jgi:hypothetical protein
MKAGLFHFNDTNFEYQEEMKMNIPSKEWIDFLREQYPVGSRIKLREMNDPYAPVEPGTMGTLESIDDVGTFHVKWDNGRGLGLVIGEDRFTVMSPALTTLKLYMPLTADLYRYDRYGDLENDSEELDGRELRKQEDTISAALIKNRLPEEKERGLMQWYGEDDQVDRKVHSAVFAVESRAGQLWGVAECQVAGELTATELNALKEYISGQASDGWGEGFEQMDLDVDDGILNVHLWNGERWSIQTEEERFGPKLESGPQMGGMTLG